MARVRNRQAGFTLIEIMAVVVIIAILAAVAIPEFMSDSRKTKASSEIMAFFSELGVRQEQYRVENGVYLTTAKCPSAPSQTGQVVDCTATTKAWNATTTTNLNVKPPTSTAFCAYTMTAGSGVSTTTVSGFSFTSPAGPWFHIVGECDMDGDGTTTKFFTSSVDSSIKRSSNADD